MDPEHPIHPVPLHSATPCKLLAWNVDEGERVRKGSLLCVYAQEVGDSDPMEGRLQLKSSVVGVVKEVLVQAGEMVPPGAPVILLEERCDHSIVVFDMCADCGLNLRMHPNTCGVLSQPVAASVSMIHGIPEIRISQKEAKMLGHKDKLRLLHHRKLALVVDLDQTLIHTSVDPLIMPGLPDVYGFNLPGHPMIYHCRLRPHTRLFLQRIAKLYELHVFTMGTKSYAASVTHILDPEKKLFCNRIISRDEFFDPHSKALRLKSVFPCGDAMVAIIDDREDVWGRCPNLVHVKPYIFFAGTADINAPPPPPTPTTPAPSTPGGTIPPQFFRPRFPPQHMPFKMRHFSRGVSEKLPRTNSPLVGARDDNASGKNSDFITQECQGRSEQPQDGLQSTRAHAPTLEKLLTTAGSELVTDETLPAASSSSVHVVCSASSIANTNTNNNNNTGGDEDGGGGGGGGKEGAGGGTGVGGGGGGGGNGGAEGGGTGVGGGGEGGGGGGGEGGRKEGAGEGRGAGEGGGGGGDEDGGREMRAGGIRVRGVGGKEMVKDKASDSSSSLSSSGNSSESEDSSSSSSSDIDDSLFEHLGEGDQEGKRKAEEGGEVKPTLQSERVAAEVEGPEDQKMDADAGEEKMDVGEVSKPACDSPEQEAVPQEAVSQEAVPQEAVPQEADPQEAVPQEAVPQEAVPQEMTDQSEGTEKRMEVIDQTDQPQKSSTPQIHDPDDFLVHLADILTRIHTTFYVQYDDMKQDVDVSAATDIPTPDLKDIIPKMRQSVLKGANILFTGVIPTNMRPERSPEWNTARAFGAAVHNKLIQGLNSSDLKHVLRATTHVVAAKAGTSKLREARRIHGIKIVNPRWLWSCAEQWKWVDERLFPVESSGDESKGETGCTPTKKMRTDDLPKLHLKLPTSCAEAKQKKMEDAQLSSPKESDSVHEKPQAGPTSFKSDNNTATAKGKCRKTSREEFADYGRHLSTESRLSVSDEELDKMEAEVDAELSSSSSDNENGAEQLRSYVSREEEDDTFGLSYEHFTGEVFIPEKQPGYSRKRKHLEVEESGSSNSPSSTNSLLNLDESIEQSEEESENESGDELADLLS